MKKLLLLGAFVAFGYMGANAQVVAATGTQVVSVANDDKPAKSDKKEKKHKKDHKSCGDEKGKSCKSSEKKSCCSDKGHTQETPAKKEDNK
jgi:hypothetical protein